MKLKGISMVVFRVVEVKVVDGGVVQLRNVDVSGVAKMRVWSEQM